MSRIQFGREAFLARGVFVSSVHDTGSTRGCTASETKIASKQQLPPTGPLMAATRAAPATRLSLKSIATT